MTAAPNASIPIPRVMKAEVDIYGIFRYASTYEQGVRLLSSGTADVESIITAGANGRSIDSGYDEQSGKFESHGVS